MNDNDFEIRRLSSEFYNAYPHEQYPEMEYKPERPYLVLLFYVDSNRFALPFRTNIRHEYCYKFKNSNRPTNSVSGIDYTKAVVVNDDRYIGERADIDDLEHAELAGNFISIANGFITYVRNYCRCIKKEISDKGKDKYRYSTLQYFHKELGISDKSVTFDPQYKRSYNYKLLKQLKEGSNMQNNS